MPENHPYQIMENFTLSGEQIVKLGDDSAPLCHGLAELLIVDVALNCGQDNPRLIFESMNSTGKALSQAGLVRNFILMSLEPGHQTRSYEDHWRPMEVVFGQQGYSEYFGSFMRHYLTIKMGEIPRTDEVYEALKFHARSQSVAEKGADWLVEDIHIYVEYYCVMVSEKESDRPLAMVFQDSCELEADMAYPFLLALYHDHKNGALSHEDFLSIIRLIESYAFRRSVCAIPTNSPSKTFATFYKVINKEKYLESIQVYFLNLFLHRRLPDDDESRRELKVHDFYNLRSRSYWL